MTRLVPPPLVPLSAEDALALEIAVRFGDIVRLALYRRICARYDRSLVYRAFREALDMPAMQVKKSRRAVFLCILYAYDHDSNTPRT